jgi:hypothetical protein
VSCVRTSSCNFSCVQGSAEAAAGQRELSAQQSVQLGLLSVAFATADTQRNDATSAESSEEERPILALAERLWDVVEETVGAGDGFARVSRFAAHLGLALVALGVVPRTSGTTSYL